MADDIIIINEGKLEQMGSPITIYKNPKTPFVAQFIGTSTILENLSGFKGYGDIPEGKKVIVRPEFVEAFKSDNKKFANLMDAVEEGVIENVVFRGSYLELTLSVNGVRLTTNRSLERRHVAICMAIFLSLFTGCSVSRKYALSILSAYPCRLLTRYPSADMDRIGKAASPISVVMSVLP